MMHSIKNLFFVLLFSVLFFNCGGGDTTTEESTKEDTAKTEETTDQVSENEPDAETSKENLNEFLISTEGSYGWRSDDDENLYDFFKDGRLAVQGPDGEATMWEGKWSLEGDQLTMECSDCGKMPAKQTVSVKKDGENLLIGEKTFTRYAPEPPSE